MYLLFFLFADFKVQRVQHSPSRVGDEKLAETILWQDHAYQNRRDAENSLSPFPPSLPPAVPGLSESPSASEAPSTSRRVRFHSLRIPPLVFRNSLTSRDMSPLSPNLSDPHLPKPPPKRLLKPPTEGEHAEHDDDGLDHNQDDKVGQVQRQHLAGAGGARYDI